MRQWTENTGFGWSVRSGVLVLASVVLFVPRLGAQVDLSAWPTVQLELSLTAAEGAAPQPVDTNLVTLTESGRLLNVASLNKVDEPQSICLLIDNSNSMKTRLPYLKTAAARFIAGLPAGDEVCVATIGPALAIHVKLTQDHAAAALSLEGIEAHGGTALIDGVMNAADYMREAARNRSRTFVLFSDGMDNRSLADAGTLLQQMERSGSPVLYMVNFNEPDGAVDSADAAGPTGAGGEDQGFAGVVEDAVARGGGTSCAPKDERALAAALVLLSQQLHGRYLLIYTAEKPERDGHERRLKVSLAAAYEGKGVSIRAPGGYYAPAQ